MTDKSQTTVHPDPMTARRIKWLASQRHFDGCSFLENRELFCSCGAPSGPHRKPRTLAARIKLAEKQIRKSFEADRRAAFEAAWREKWRDRQRRIIQAIEQDTEAPNAR